MALPFVRADPLSGDVQPVKTVKPDWSVYEQREDGIRFTWLGHAVRLSSLSALTDASFLN